MTRISLNSFSLRFNRITIWLAAGAMLLSLAPAAHAKKKDKKSQELVEAPKPVAPKVDTSKLVWPSPPDVARIRYLGELTGDPIPDTPVIVKKKKQSWMDRVAGIDTTQISAAPKAVVLAKPYGVAYDSKNRFYTADPYVGAVFIFNFETKTFETIRNGRDATFKLIVGVAVDDDDRLFVSDGALNHISLFDANHKFVQNFGQGDFKRPGCMTIDKENRFLYVVDTEGAKIVVYDADSLKKLRTIGHPPKVEGEWDEGDFIYPNSVAVDKDGNVYVTDMGNNRVQIFDAEGNFIRMWGKEGDGPGTFMRPKGIAVDEDGHVWVVDAMQGRMQVFDQEGHLLAYFGSTGTLPGQFGLPSGMTIDAKHRVAVAEQLSGRLQVFRYITDEEAAKEKAERAQRSGAPALQNQPQTEVKAEVRQ